MRRYDSKALFLCVLVTLAFSCLTDRCHSVPVLTIVQDTTDQSNDWYVTEDGQSMFRIRGEFVDDNGNPVEDMSAQATLRSIAPHWMPSPAATSLNGGVARDKSVFALALSVGACVVGSAVGGGSCVHLASSIENGIV